VWQREPWRAAGQSPCVAAELVASAGVRGVLPGHAGEGGVPRCEVMGGAAGSGVRWMWLCALAFGWARMLLAVAFRAVLLAVLAAAVRNWWRRSARGLSVAVAVQWQCSGVAVASC